jgi:hypothetical protein
MLILLTACGSSHSIDVSDGAVAPMDGRVDAIFDAGLVDAAPDALPSKCALWSDVQSGSPLDDEVLAIAAADDVVYVAGYAEGHLGISNIQPAGDSHGFVRAHDNGGRVLWERRIDTGDTDVIEALTVADGMVFAAGRTRGSLPGATSAGQFDAFVAMFDRDGRPIDAVQLGEVGPEHPRQIVADPDDGLLLAGYTDIYVAGSAVVEWEDPFVARVKRSGLAGTTLSLDWWWRARTGAADVAEGIAAGAGGPDFFVVGTNITGIERSAWARRRDRSGGGWSPWARRLTTAPGDAMVAARMSPDGHLVVSGYTSAELERASGWSDAFVAKLERDTGETLWVRQLGSAEIDEARALAVGDDGTIYVAGDTYGPLGGPARGGRDLFVGEVQPDGRWIATWQGGSSADDHVRATAIDSCGQLLVAGGTDGELAGRNAGRRDGFVSRVDLTARGQPR